jgi:hypothetical protein
LEDFVFVQRHQAHITDDYWCEIDEYRRAGGEQFLLAHIRVHHWSPSVCKRLLKEFRAFRRVCRAPLYACPEVADEKWVKFVSLLGFKPLQEVICDNGDTRPLFIHII